MSTLTKIVNSIRFVGLIPSIRTIKYALYRDHQDRKLRQKLGPLITPGEVTEVLTSPRGAEFHFARHKLSIQFLAEDLVQLHWEPGTHPISYAIEKTEWPLPAIGIEQIEDGWKLSTDRISVRVDVLGNLGFYSGQMLLRKDYTPKLSDISWSQTSDLHPKEAIYGLGLRAAPLNLRGKKLRMWNLDPGGSINPGDDPLYVCIPVYMGVHPGGSYLVFYENYHDGWFTFQEHLHVEMLGGALRYYFMSGSPAELLGRYTELTGRPNLPPRWALGYHQSRWGYHSETDIRKVVEGFHQHDIPIDNIHLDIDYMRGYRVFTVDEERFPNLTGLTSELQQKNLRAISILDPGVKIDPEYRVYRDGLEQDVYVKTRHGDNLKALVWPGWCVFPDFTSPKTREWWGRYYQHLLDQGIAGIWHDMNEPTAFAAWGEPTFPRSARHDMEGEGGTHLAAHNLFGFQMNRAGFESLRELRPDKRPWILSRSGWAGTQRYSWNWTGDINGTWDMLRQTIPSILGLTLSGYYYSGSDIGGFSSHPEKELYIRWFQLAAFTPFFRLHNATGLPSREPWCYDEEAIGIVRETIRLRRQLLPYWYTLAWQAAEEGKPLVRPLFWLDPENADLWEIDDSFLVGEHLLVAPILSSGGRKRSVLLPIGDWYELETDAYHVGPGPLEVDAPLASIPVFVKAGAFLPFERDGQVELHLYPPDMERGQGQGIFESLLYQDAGDGYDSGRLDRFALQIIEGVLHLEHSFTGSYQPAQSHYTVIVHGLQAHAIVINGRRTELADNQCLLEISKPV